MEMDSIITKAKLLVKKTVFWHIYAFMEMLRFSNLSIFEFLKNKKNYIFMCPSHNNAGDLAQTICLKEWITKYYAGIVLVVIRTAPSDAAFIKNICRYIHKDDNVFIHSGFNITDKTLPYAGPNVFPSHKIILKMLPEHNIVFFQQSVEYRSIETWRKISDMYAEHKRIVFISRDKVSEDYARVLLPNAIHLAYPDIVLSWVDTKKFKWIKSDFSKPLWDVMLCLRGVMSR